MVPAVPASPFRTRGFVPLQLARFFSICGSQIQSVVVGWHVYDITHRPLDLGYVGLALFLPIAVFSLISGHVADRFDRRFVGATCNAVQFAATCTLAFLATHRDLGVAPIYATLIVVGTARAFAGPAMQALLPSLVPPEILSRAIAWSSTFWQVAAVVGPSSAGVLLTLLGSTSRVYIASAVCTVVAAALLVSLPKPARAPSGRAISKDTLLAGVRFVLANKIVLGVTSLDLFAVLFGGAVALLPIYARDILAVGGAGFGALRAAPAVGASVMAVFLSQRPLRRHLGRTMFSAVLVFGVATVVFALSRDFSISLVALFVVGASDMISVVVRQTLVQTATPDEMRGRVGAVNLVFIGASNELGEMESGVTAEWMGVRTAAAVGGLATCGIVGLWAFLFPTLRKADTPESARLDRGEV